MSFSLRTEAMAKAPSSLPPSRTGSGADVLRSQIRGRELCRNLRGLLRQYLPKGIDVSTYSQAKLNALARRLNERSRKTLDFHTPGEMFSQIVASTG